MSALQKWSETSISAANVRGRAPAHASFELFGIAELWAVMRICLPILAGVVAICLCFGPLKLPLQNGAMMQPPLPPDVLRDIYHAGRRPAASADDSMSRPLPTTAPAPSTAPAPAHAIAGIHPAQ